MVWKSHDIKYTSNHIWVRQTDSKNAFIGITEYFLRNWENIISISLPEVGDEIEQDTPFGEIESEDSTVSIISPLTGKVRAVNKEVLKDPNILFEDPYEDGWLLQIRLNDPTELESLLDKAEYENTLKYEEEIEGEISDEEEEFED